MTQRERKATAGNGPGTAVLEPPRAGLIADGDAVKTLTWEEFYRHASTLQRDELLALARRQGLLYGYQIPAPANNNKTSPAEETVRWNRLNHLLTGHGENWCPVNEPPLTIIDSALDAAQRQAVT